MTKRLMPQDFAAALLVASSILVTSCATSGNGSNSSKSDDLDISMTRIEPALVQQLKSGKDKHGKTLGVEVTAEEQLSWRQFFKAPPAVDKRSEIESKIKAWKTTQSPEELVKRGQNEAALGKLSASEASYREALRLDPKNLEAALELSGNYLKRNDLTRAFEMLSQVRDGINARSKTPADLVFRYRYVLALAYINRGDRDKGHKVLSDLIGINKSFAPGYAALASSYMNLGKDGVAEFIAKRGLDRGNDDPMLMNILGVLAERKNEGVAARSWYNKAIEATPTFSPALVNRANLAIKELEYGPAEEDLLRALMYTPTSIDAQVALAIVFRRTGRTNLAKDTLTKALEQDPDSAIARFNLGVLMMADLNQSATATRLFNEVLQISGSHAELRDQAKNHLAELRIQNQSTDE